MTCVILDPGHEGISPGRIYLRHGKQSPEVPPGIYEGEFNRNVAQHVADYLHCDSVITNPGPINCTLAQRWKYANALHAVRGDCIFVSIHANASPKPGWSSAHGCRTFTSPRASAMSLLLSDSIRGAIVEDTEISDRGGRKRNFSVLTRTLMPAVYVECGFMTNREEAIYMASHAWRIGMAIARGIEDLLT